MSNGYGKSPYGTSPYGTISPFPAPPLPIDVTSPTVLSANSVDGFQIAVLFSEEMRVNADLTSTLSYSVVSLLGGAPVTILSVVVGSGATSVVLTHSGSTLGAEYRITVVGPEDLAGNTVESSGFNTADFLALGSPPTYTVVPLSGGSVLLDFDQEMLPSSVVTGILDPIHYLFTTSPSYPVTLEATSVTHPYLGDSSKVHLDVRGMTSLWYTLSVEPADAIAYKGVTLPSASTEFLGTEVGTGISTIVGIELVLAKNVGVSYGWNFEDLTGKILPNSSFKVSLSFDASVATYTPALLDAVVGAFYINDGLVEAVLYVERLAGVDVLTLQSGAYSTTVPVSWSTQETSCDLVRNDYAGIYTLVVNGTPVVSTLLANFTGVPSIPPGVQFLLSGTYQVANFLLSGVVVTASQTILSNAWNFLHNHTSLFLGSAASTRQSLVTQNGPLVKGWGDGTPATIQDVTVRVNNTPVTVSAVNPYNGEITLAIPVPLMPPGLLTVAVDYKWFPVPLMEFSGLNTPGLVLNKWDNARGLQDPVVSGGLGALDKDSRFPMRLVLGPLERMQPLRIGHRFLGFEVDYSALLNSPTTLLLNQNPHSIAVNDFEESPFGVSIGYDGRTTPLMAENPWKLQGADVGFVSADGETYTLIDDSSGSFGIGTEGFYYQDVDLSFASVVTIATRFYATTYQLDGVFSGLGFGVHNNRRVFFVGCLIINQVQHLGILKEVALPHLASSWELAATRNVVILDARTCSFDASSFPTSLEEGNRFQILDGPQTGTYQIESFDIQGDETLVTVSASTPFPADPYYYGNDTADAVFELPWEDTIATYRLVVHSQDGRAQLFVSGEVSTLALSLTALPEVALSAQTTFMLDTTGSGQVFWGSLGKIPTNTSVWSFFRYGILPEQTTFHSQAVIVSSDFSAYLPEEDPNSEWFRTQDFGYVSQDVPNSGILLKSTSADTGLPVSFGFERLEPFLSSEDHVDVDGSFWVDSGTSGFGDAQVSIRDTVREVRFGTILYRESFALSPYRQLVSLPTVSLTGLQTPEVLGWSLAVLPYQVPPTMFARGKRVTSIQVPPTTLDTCAGIWSESLDVTGLNFSDTVGRILEARLLVSAYTADSTGNTGIIFGGEAPYLGSGRVVSLTFKDTGAKQVCLTSGNNTSIQAYTFDWTDGVLHDYRVLIDSVVNTVTLVIDDVVQVPTVALSSFSVSSTSIRLFLGALPSSYWDVTTHTVEWDSISLSVRPPVDAKRTLGVWLGGDVTDIDNFRLPRTDSTSAANSTNLASLEEMDWRSPITFRIHRDASWGVIIQRPDLPLPPWYTGQFATEATEPSAGWISVEYPKLPLQGETFGKILWGSLSSSSISQQRWSYLRYHIYNTYSTDYRSPQDMVLNRVNVITSGEPLVDKTPEVVVVTSLTSTMVSLRSIGVFAHDIYRVLDDQTPIPYGEWRFDVESQTIFLTNALSGSQVPVTVVFSPGKPYTSTYLAAQPLFDSMTLLNEGTPPLQWQQGGESTTIVVAGTTLSDPNSDFIVNDPYNYLQDVEDAEAIYDDLEFITVDNGGSEGLLSTICDDTFSGHGLLEVGLSGGRTFYETFKTPVGDYTGILGVPSPYSSGSTPVFYASGGHYVGGTVGPGTSLVIANYPSVGRSGEGSGAINRGVTLQLSISSVLRISGNVVTEVDLVDTYNSSAIVDVVSAELETMASYTRAGPWGGESSLTVKSLVAGGLPYSADSFNAAGGVALAPSTKANFPL